jgi:leucyl aminopeptidase
MLEFTFAKATLPKTGAIALFIAEGEAPSGLWAKLEEASGGAISRAIHAAEFKGTARQTCTILAPMAGLSRVVLVGLGKPEELNRLVAEQAGGLSVAALLRDSHAALVAPSLGPQDLAATALGALLRSYRFDRYRTQEKPEDKPRLTRITVLSDDTVRARAAFAPMRAVAEGSFLTRDLVSEPPNVLNPAEFAERCKTLSNVGIKVDILGLKELTKLGFGALLGVAQGSVNEPRVVVMQWNGTNPGRGKRQPVAFIGKGVTFDSGGISIKPAGGMEDMKWDMAGAGTVVGLMAALAGRAAKVDAVGIIGLVENMPSGSAQRPGDVVRSYSGQTVEIINTDAEGRMVLADLLWYCQSKFNPRFMIDLATLTGAIIVALGHEYAGLFSNDDDLSAQLAECGKTTGEPVWRMPLDPAFDRQLKSEIADMKHVTGRPGSSITAAQFLQRFVNGKPWVHLDIAGMAWSTKDAPCIPKGATAYGLRLLDHLVAEHFER